MLRTHKIMIEQGSGEKSVYAILRLTDKNEVSGKSASGRWVHSEDSTDEGRIKFTSDAKEHLYWEWKSEAPATMLIGSKMARASHKAGEGTGTLTYDVGTYFKKGAITWTIVAY